MKLYYLKLNNFYIIMFFFFINIVTPKFKTIMFKDSPKN